MRIFKILVKIFKDPSFSCQDLQGSLIFLPRSSRIFDFSSGSVDTVDYYILSSYYIFNTDNLSVLNI